VVTLLPVGGPAAGVTTAGLRWPLVADYLLPASTRGVSNEIVTSPATVSVATGVVLAVQPLGEQ
jgi:thiamine pyrophosphokinase